MKKFIALLTAAVMLGGTASAFAETFSTVEFGYTDGVITGYTGQEMVTVPSELMGNPVTDIGDMAFFDLDIASLHIDEGIKTIGIQSFEGTNIEFANLPASLISVAESAFANCKNLSTVILNSETTDFASGTFAGTGHIQFVIPCTANVETYDKSIAAAKGDTDFDITKRHTGLVENVAEKTESGENVVSCNACGFKGSPYDVTVPMLFTDVPDEQWYHTSVSMAYSFGIIDGETDSVFDPDAGLTCAAAAKIAACVYAYKTGVQPDFSETGDHWYDTYVNFCYANGILESDVSFDWESYATRAQMAYLFARCNTEKTYINEVTVGELPDVDGSTPYADEIVDLYNKGIVGGNDDRLTFAPDSNIKRSETAALIARMLCYEMRIQLAKG